MSCGVPLLAGVFLGIAITGLLCGAGLMIWCEAYDEGKRAGRKG
jgi:hypothetical protein